MRTMTGMVDLLDILELVVNGFNDGTFAKPEFVVEGDEAIGHILAKGCHEL